MSDVVERIRRYFFGETSDLRVGAEPEKQLYECFNCESKKERLYECDVCHAFVCVGCILHHDCKVVERSKDYNDGISVLKEHPLGKEFQDGIIAMAMRHKDLQEAAKSGRNPPPSDREIPLKREIISDGTGKIHEKYRK